VDRRGLLRVEAGGADHHGDALLDGDPGMRHRGGRTVKSITASPAPIAAPASRRFSRP
jgi:hypothetical protein